MTPPDDAADAQPTRANIEEADLDPGVEQSGTEAPAEEGAPAWTTTFGDMMSLLLTFFILLFSMSSIEVEKFKAAAESLREGFSSSVIELLPANRPSPRLEPAPPIPGPPVAAATPGPQPPDLMLARIAATLERFVIEHGLEQNLVVVRTEEGVYLRIQDVALFRPGSAEIEPSGAAIVAQLGALTAEIQVALIVSGHTDNVPIRNAMFASNWELSAARAAGLARRLVVLGLDPEMVRVEAFGEYRPVEANETPEGRAQNRRVELFYSRQNAEAIVYTEPLPADTTTGDTAVP